MLDIINRPELKKYTVDFPVGESLFLEGDSSQDMYILVSGRLEIYKDDKKISEITEPGSMVGEMSYLLGSRRTATVKAGTDVKVIHIPSGQVTDFINDFPDLAPEITRGLARRLQDTTKVVHGLKEFCDQLPDAVVMTDKECKILAWNRAAEKLYGRTWQQMQGHSIKEIYRDPVACQDFIDDVQVGQSLREKVMVIIHPDDEERFVSFSTTILYDGHHNLEGYILMGRDVTRVKNLEQKYERVRKWLIPAAVICALLVVAIFAGLPYFTKGAKILDHKKQSFRNRIVMDSHLLAREIGSALQEGGPQDVRRVMADYFVDGEARLNGIGGVLLLDRNKKVINGYFPGMDEGLQVSEMGSNYSGISFKGKESSPYRVLSLFRSDKNHHLGVKGTEIAYQLQGAEGGWLVFQLDMEQLDRESGIDADSLEDMEF
jgi:PAS domain S-box-containing protein